MRAEPTRHVRERNQRLLLLYRNEYIHNCQDWLSLGGTLLGSAAARRRFGIGRSAWWKSLAKPSPTPRRAESRPATAPLRRRMRRDPHFKASMQQGSPPPISENPPPHAPAAVTVANRRESPPAQARESSPPISARGGPAAVTATPVSPPQAICSSYSRARGPMAALQATGGKVCMRRERGREGGREGRG